MFINNAVYCSTVDQTEGFSRNFDPASGLKIRVSLVRFRLWAPKYSAFSPNIALPTQHVVALILCTTCAQFR
jgi:hypothetical protein